MGLDQYRLEKITQQQTTTIINQLSELIRSNNEIIKGNNEIIKLLMQQQKENNKE